MSLQPFIHLGSGVCTSHVGETTNQDELLGSALARFGASTLRGCLFLVLSLGDPELIASVMVNRCARYGRHLDAVLIVVQPFDTRKPRGSRHMRKGLNWSWRWWWRRR
jgi:hypothetical protein